MNKRICINLAKGSFTVFSTYLYSYIGGLSPALILLIFLMVIDYISGMLASKKEAMEHPDNERYGWSSKKSIIGIYKKVGYMLTVLVALCIDYIIYVILINMSIEFQTKTAFGLVVTVWFIINELLSILENSGRMGATLPKFLKRVLCELRKEIDDHSDM